jgi:hypothetical protein
LALLDPLGQSLGLDRRAGGCLGELRQPAADASESVSREPADIGLRLCREDQADRRDVVADLAPAAQDGVDERAAYPTVAVGERVDGLELSVGDPSLDDWRWTIGARSMRLTNVHRSSSSGRTCSGGGGT